MLTGLLGTPVPALAALTTTARSAVAIPGPASLVAGNRTLSVKIPYTGDDTTPNNTAFIEWDEDGGDWASLVGSQALAHSASPYSYDITGLDNSVTYQVRVTIIDADGGSNLVQTLTGLKTYNPLVHNAVATDSDKHSGNWGLADDGSLYGEFTCATCHTRNTSNIKRIKGTITAPSGNFPGSTVSFLSVEDNTSDFGDDSVIHANSERVCEVCHSATAYHNYNQGSTTDHYNKTDCTSCHKHNKAFQASCSGCHGNSATGAMWPDDSTTHAANDDPNGRHAKHIEVLADTAFTQTLAELLADASTETKQKALCEYCHAANSNDGDHASATTADVFIDSDLVRHAKNTWNTADGDALYNSTNDTCSNIDCHNSKPTTIGSYGWYDAGTSTCDLCHSADPGTGAHTAHISGTYGPNLGVKCGDCHEANNYNSNMTGISSHMDGNVDFTGGVLLAAATDCNNCHGGATPAATAKTNWATASAVTCESCHGANTAATRNADGTGVAAPVRTANYATKGHGKESKACTECHDASAAHISGTLDDANRIKTIATKNYDTAGQENDWCNGCHAAAMPVHYANSRTVDGASDDGIYCNQCHDPHGNSGYDAMVASSVNGNTIAAFNDRTQRSDYANGTFDGVCQVCHALENAGQVDYFNRSENEAHYAGNCISCHQHDDSEAFKPSGCNGCHGDATAGNYWPDQVAYPDRDALHTIHVDPIGQKLAGVNDGTWAAMAAADKLNHKNNTCDYCHPDPGGTNATGGGHDANTNLSPASVADLHKDGYNPATSYKTMLGAADSDGLYNPTIKRCSTVDCHSNGEFTWTWYGDTIAPGTISDLTAVTGSEPGSVDLNWTAPNNDGAEGPNAYHYRIKYRTGGGVTDGTWAGASDGGGPPTVTRRGNAATMTVYGLTPGTTYFFGVQTADEEYNWSATSNSPSAAARADDQAPVFWGLSSAVADDESGVVDLEWDEAQDHSLPITYKIWYSVGTIDFGTAHQATTQGRNYRVTGLPIGVLYNFGVRATDSAGNTDINTTTRAALSRTPSKLPYAVSSHYTSGTTALQTGSYGTANSSTLAAGATRTWQGPAYAVDTNSIGTTFYAKMSNGNENLAGLATGEFGYITGASTWNNFTPALSSVQAVPPNARNKLMRFAFGGGGKIPAGAKPAVRIRNTGSLSYTVTVGSATNRGDIDIQEQTFNHLPSAPVFNPAPSGSGLVTIDWNPSTDSDGHTIHYDVYGSDDGGVSWDYIIASDVPAATTAIVWDTIATGIGLSAANNNVRVKVFAADGYMDGDNTTNHSETLSAAWTVDNTLDTIAPAAVIDLSAEERPKTGSIYLSWTAPGDDGNGIAPASSYDIRYSTADITTDGQFTAATTTFGEPVPDFGGTRQGFEVLGLTPGTHYYFALKTADEASNTSALSNSGDANGGLKCGICHGTPPDDSATGGNHIAHGYTLNDCAKCHGPVTDYNTTKHQDGQLKVGFGRDASGNRLAPVTATVTGVNSENIAYWQNGVKIYEDTNGAGGINETAWVSSDKQDTGTCAGFIGVNASGCHGPAAPVWDEAATLVCADCHGDNSRTLDPYGRAFDDTTDAVKASPPNDNHGFTGGEPEKYKRRYVGAHEKHLNFSFRFAKGSSCNICHKGNNHGDGVIDMNYESGAGAGALWTPYVDGGTPTNDTDDAFGTCGGTSDLSCHGVALTPKWDSQVDIACNSCHGFGGAPPDHVTDPNGTGFVDDGLGNCEWCHPGGHPRDAVAGTVLVPNNVTVGLYYASGGVHLKNNIGGRTAVTTEAEVCWGCHANNGISEWGTNTDANTGSSTYNYGAVTSSNWTTATWSSANTNFAYKTGSIKSTHSASPDGTSTVAFNNGATPKRYDETVDAVANIRCSNCHDVHNRNLAPNDTLSGTPYLRGTWMGNPYPEDGAPWNKTYTGYTIAIGTHSYARPTVGFGAVPRGGTQYQAAGGYFIDENSGFPTKGWTYESSAGLCILCHGDNVDELDQRPGENLWLGTNGHSNSALGGTGSYAVNIFDYTHGRPVPSTNATLASESYTNRVPDMGNQRAAEVVGDQYYTYGYRRQHVSPYTYNGNAEHLDNLAFDWGVTVDAGTTDKWYHQFSCSKCHNPHASRLPKLLITNCLDVRQNTWDDAKGTQTVSTASTSDQGKKIAYFNSAQNCHRRDSSRNAGATEAAFKDKLNGGWNHVTPW